MSGLIDRFISWLYIRRIWGERCSEIEPECIVCKKWIEHDEIFNEEDNQDDPEI